MLEAVLTCSGCDVAMTICHIATLILQSVCVFVSCRLLMFTFSVIMMTAGTAVIGYMPDGRYLS